MTQVSTSRLPPSASTVPQKRGLEADGEGEDDEGDWTELAWEGQMAKVKRGRIAYLEFDGKFMS